MRGAEELTIGFNCCRIQIGQDLPFVQYVPQVIRHYGKAVANGHQHIYQTVPRLLTVYFEFGMYCAALPETSRQTAQVQLLLYLLCDPSCALP